MKDKSLKIATYIIIGGLILSAFTPILFTRGWSGIDFSGTGGIGDTIGGITAPFINGLAAILVFLAFKAQIKANEIFKRQESSRIILDQITLIQEDKLEIAQTVKSILTDIEMLKSPYKVELLTLINNVRHFTNELRLAHELIEKFDGDKDFLSKKLYCLYDIKYRSQISILSVKLEGISSEIHNDYDVEISDLLSDIEILNEELF